MGISIPDGFRPDLAMAGEWQVTSERIIDLEEQKKPEAVALGVRKRAVEQDEDEEEGAGDKKRRWGATYKTHPAQADDEDLDALLNNVTRKDKGPVLKAEEDSKEYIKKEPETDGTAEIQAPDIPVSEEQTGIKKEPCIGEVTLPATIPQFDDGVKKEGEEENGPGVVFKKRKAKNIRQK
jgi:hypothetical protein